MFRPSWRAKPVPRVLRSREGEMFVRRDGIWGVEQKLRFVLGNNPGQPEFWYGELSKWAKIHRDSDRIWRLVELVLFDWLLDDLILTELHNDIQTLLVTIAYAHIS